MGKQMEADDREVQAELAKICQTYGTLQPDTVIKEASRNPSGAIYKRLEWNDSVAAHQHRLYQARKLIQSVKLDVVYESVVLKAPFYVRDPNRKPEEQGYVPIASLIDDRELAKRELERELARVAACLDRARGAAAALGIVEDFDRLTETIRSEFDNLTQRVNP